MSRHNPAVHYVPRYIECTICGLCVMEDDTRENAHGDPECEACIGRLDAAYDRVLEEEEEAGIPWPVAQERAQRAVDAIRRGGGVRQ